MISLITRIVTVGFTVLYEELKPGEIPAIRCEGIQDVLELDVVDGITLVLVEDYSDGTALLDATNGGVSKDMAVIVGGTTSDADIFALYRKGVHSTLARETPRAEVVKWVQTVIDQTIPDPDS